jgi:flagella basal body P-ring formation protein FlgA
MLGFLRWSAARLLPLACTAGSLLLAGAEPNQPPGVESAMVLVALQPTASVSNREVHVADVATLLGGSPELRDQIAQLDLADPPRPGQVLRMKREQISYRILIAGVDPGSFQLSGAAQCQLTLQQYDVPEEHVLAAASRAVRDRVPGRPEACSIRLAQPIRGPLRVPGVRDDVQIDAELRGSRPPLGRIRVDVTISSQGERQFELPVLLEVHLFEEVAVSTRRIERGQTVSEQNIRFDRRTVDTLSDYFTVGDSPIGRKARRTIMPLQVITGTDVELAVQPNATAIKQRDMVQMVARKGSLQVSTVGEALQDGRAGQVIRVRNIDSKKEVQARVVARALVEVIF